MIGFFSSYRAQKTASAQLGDPHLDQGPGE